MREGGAKSSAETTPSNCCGASPMTEPIPPIGLPPTTVFERPLTAAANTESRSAGRPYGAKTPVLAGRQVLHHAHFSYVRFAIHGFTLRDAWLHCLAFTGGTLDERYFRRRLREVCAQIRVGAAARDLASVADVALRGLAAQWRRLVAAPAAGGATADEVLPTHEVTQEATPIQTLDEWIDARFDELGIDADFQTQAEWLIEYREEFGLGFDLEVDQAGQTVAAEAAAAPAQRARCVGWMKLMVTSRTGRAVTQGTEGRVCARRSRRSTSSSHCWPCRHSSMIRSRSGWHRRCASSCARLAF